MKRLKLLALSATAAFGLNAAVSAPVMAQAAEPYIGQLALFATDWCPRGWHKADGALLSIAQNNALYSLYGVTYGGNGTTNFALPNLQGRAPVSYSATMPLGQPSGATTATLTLAQMPTHNHMLLAAASGPVTNSPSGGSLATFPPGTPIYAAASETPSVAMHPNVLTPSGGNQPFSIQNPVLSMNWCVSLQGLYPSRP